MPVTGIAGSAVTIPDTAPVRKGYTFYGWAAYKYDCFTACVAGDSYTLSDNTTLYAIWEMPDGVKAKGKHPNTDMSWILYYDGNLVIDGTGSVYGDNSSSTDGYKHYLSDIKNVTVNEGITGIGNNAFYNAPLTGIVLPETLESIGNNAFSYSGIKSITIPSSVSSIGAGILMGSNIETINLGNPSYSISAIFTGATDMSILNSITVDENNSLYSVENGVLYNKDKTTLIRVPATVSGQLVIPDTVTSISKYALADTHSLESVVIPVSVNNIGDRVFNDAHPVVYYKGTEAQWGSIAIGTVWNDFVPAEYEYGKTYAVKYDANGGTGVPEDGEKVKGTDYIISETVPKRDGFVFVGWATSKNASEAEYQPGSSYTENSEVTLYAVWELPEPSVSFSPFGNYWLFDVAVDESNNNHSTYVAVYGENGVFMYCAFAPVENGSSNIVIKKITGAKEAKVFVWSNSNTPCTKVYPVPIN